MKGECARGREATWLAREKARRSVPLTPPGVALKADGRQLSILPPPHRAERTHTGTLSGYGSGGHEHLPADLRRTIFGRSATGDISLHTERGEVRSWLSGSWTVVESCSPNSNHWSFFFKDHSIAKRDCFWFFYLLVLLYTLSFKTITWTLMQKFPQSSPATSELYNVEKKIIQTRINN